VCVQRWVAYQLLCALQQLHNAGVRIVLSMLCIDNCWAVNFCWMGACARICSCVRLCVQVCAFVCMCVHVCACLCVCVFLRIVYAW